MEVLNQWLEVFYILQLALQFTFAASKFTSSFHNMKSILRMIF